MCADLNLALSVVRKEVELSNEGKGKKCLIKLFLKSAVTALSAYALSVPVSCRLTRDLVVSIFKGSIGMGSFIACFMKVSWLLLLPYCLLHREIWRQKT